MPSEHKERRKEKQREKEKEKQRQHQKPKTKLKIKNAETEERNVVPQVSETSVTEAQDRPYMTASINGGGRTVGTTDPQEAIGKLSHILTLPETKTETHSDRGEMAVIHDDELDLQEHGTCQMTLAASIKTVSQEEEMVGESHSARDGRGLLHLFSHHSSRKCGRKTRCWSDGDIPVEKQEISLMAVSFPLPAPMLNCWPDESAKINKCWFNGSFQFQELNPTPSQTARVVEQPGITAQSLERSRTTVVPTATTTSRMATNGSTTKVPLTNTVSAMCISKTEPLDTSSTVEALSMVTDSLPMARSIEVLPETSTSNTPATYPDGCMAVEISGEHRTHPKSAKSLSEWSSKRKLRFIQAVSNWTKARKGGKVHHLEYGSDKIFNGNWTCRLCSKVQKVLQWKKRRVKYDGSAVKDLLRFIRNVSSHYDELHQDVQKALGSTQENIWDYFAARFPSLLEHTYHVMKRFAEEAAFKSYYKTE